MGAGTPTVCYARRGPRGHARREVRGAGAGAPRRGPVASGRPPSRLGPNRVHGGDAVGAGHMGDRVGARGDPAKGSARVGRGRMARRPWISVRRLPRRRLRAESGTRTEPAGPPRIGAAWSIRLTRGRIATTSDPAAVDVAEPRAVAPQASTDGRLAAASSRRGSGAAGRHRAWASRRSCARAWPSNCYPTTRGRPAARSQRAVAAHGKAPASRGVARGRAVPVDAAVGGGAGAELTSGPRSSGGVPPRPIRPGDDPLTVRRRRAADSSCSCRIVAPPVNTACGRGLSGRSAYHGVPLGGAADRQRVRRLRRPAPASCRISRSGG